MTDYSDIIENSTLSFGQRYRMIFKRWTEIKYTTPMRDSIDAARFDAARSSLELQILLEEKNMTKITIDLNDDDIKSEWRNYRIWNKVSAALEAEKNKIQIGEWVSDSISNTDMAWRYQGHTPVGQILKKLSQPLQDLLNKEIK